MSDEAIIATAIDQSLLAKECQRDAPELARNAEVAIVVARSRAWGSGLEFTAIATKAETVGFSYGAGGENGCSVSCRGSSCSSRFGSCCILG